jgi:hypothetical protein
VDADGRTLVDVADPLGTLACRVAGSPRAVPSIDGAWAGRSLVPGTDRLCWALAAGHAPAGLGHAVEFVGSADESSGRRATLPPEAPAGFWVTDDGLWVAAAVGSYTHVRLTAQSATLLRPLEPVTG